LADDVLSRSAADIIALYRSKQVSPVEIMTATLDRIDRLNRLHNAFVMIDREAALGDARASEERWRRGKPNGLIDGLPVTHAVARTVVSKKKTGPDRYAGPRDEDSLGRGYAPSG
jgi:hypothetical protein